jgi:hypothetical protein
MIMATFALQLPIGVVRTASLKKTKMGEGQAPVALRFNSCICKMGVVSSIRRSDGSMK